jgi:hypothetical protein
MRKNSMLKRAIHLGILFLLAFVFQISAQQSEKKVFSGTLGETRIQMTLEKNGRELRGTYFYQKIGRDIALSGSIDESGNFTLTETSPKGVKTGSFSGTWSKSEADDTNVLNGEWKSANGAKKFDFYLIEQMIFFKGPARLAPKVFSETNKAKIFEITAEYPELSGVDPQTALKFNQTAKSLVMTEVEKFRRDFLAQTAEDLKFARENGTGNTVEISYNITYADERVISVWFGNYFYTGGAHPNSYSFTLNFDLRTGRVLKLADLFGPGSDYLQVLSDYSIEKLQQDLYEGRSDEWITEGAAPEEKNYDSWNISKRGIIINFDAYQVAPYVAGPQEVLVPFEKLEPILRREFAVLKNG